jgi:drug/metabolite transporter (DMT)-like permease
MAGRRVDADSPLPVLSLIAAAVIWSSGGLLIKLVSWNAPAIAGVRSAISALFIYGVVRKPAFTFSRHQLAGAGCYAASVILFVSATKLTTAANAILLQYTAPVYIALFSRPFLDESIEWHDWVACTVVLGGILLFFLDNLTVGGYLGNGLALASGIAVAWIGLLLRKQKDASPIETVLLGNMVTAVVCAPFYFTAPAPGGLDWLGLLVLGVVQLGLPYTLYANAIRRVRAFDAMLIFTIEPILNPVWVFLAIGERPGPWAFVGGGIVIVTLLARGVYRNLRRKTISITH